MSVVVLLLALLAADAPAPEGAAAPAAQAPQLYRIEPDLPSGGSGPCASAGVTVGAENPAGPRALGSLPDALAVRPVLRSQSATCETRDIVRRNVSTPVQPAASDSTAAAPPAGPIQAGPIQAGASGR